MMKTLKCHVKLFKEAWNGWGKIYPFYTTLYTTVYAQAAPS